MVVDDLLQTVKLLLIGLVALHRTVVYAPHADGKDMILSALYLLETLCPVLLHSFTISPVVETSALSAVPFSDIIAQQRLTMRRAYHDATRVGHSLGTRRLEECCRALVHGWPDGVGSQTEQQLEYLLVGLRSNQSVGSRRKILTTPRARTPVLIVDKDAAIGHTRRVLHREIIAECQPLFLLRHQIAPPYPRRDTCQARKFQNAIGRTTRIMTVDVYLSVAYRDAETIVGALTL